jgi:hypothetical protein
VHEAASQSTPHVTVRAEPKVDIYYQLSFETDYESMRSPLGSCEPVSGRCSSGVIYAGRAVSKLHSPFSAVEENMAVT